MGTGYAQTNNGVNVCVGSDRYIKNLTSLFLDYQKRFDIDYWKLDGFALRPCTSENHDHMTEWTQQYVLYNRPMGKVDRCLGNNES